MTLFDKLSAGNYQIEYTIRGTVRIDDDDDLTIADAIDLVAKTGSIVDWTVD